MRLVIKRSLLLLGVLALLSILNGQERAPGSGQNDSGVWVPDIGNGMYKNPVIFADYSDPDVCRVGDDYYLTGSSFDAIPGLPVLHSRDLVHWTIIGHALPAQPLYDHYSQTQHGNGVWAPAIRYHDGEFYIFYPDPDFGIYMVKANSPAGPWSDPVLVRGGKGLIDPCPLWDDDGKAYLVHAYAGSRAGIKSILTVNRMSPDGASLLDKGVIVYDGHEQDPTIEGPKFYKRNGYYYIFAPAGGVTHGWQIVLRSRDIYGPYERRVVMHQGSTSINGPHQGAWVTTPEGASWFVHFQDRGSYGRVVLLEPMRWANDWPVIGTDPDGDGTGEPVQTYPKPLAGKEGPVLVPQASDEFTTTGLGLQWQWQANPRETWAYTNSGSGALRLYCQVVPEGAKNLWDVPNLLLQKFPAPTFTVTTKITFQGLNEGDKAGFIVLGASYTYLALIREDGNLWLDYVTCHHADQGAPESRIRVERVTSETVYFSMSVTEDARCLFSYSPDGNEYHPIDQAPFQAVAGRWIGAKMGLFCTGTEQTHDSGYADIDWFRVTKPVQ